MSGQRLGCPNGKLVGIVVAVRGLFDADVDVYLNVNNHYEGCASKTIEGSGRGWAATTAEGRCDVGTRKMTWSAKKEGT